MPAESVNRKKLNHFVNASKYFIYKNHIYREKMRFDIIEVYIEKNSININHIKNILI